MQGVARPDSLARVLADLVQLTPHDRRSRPEELTRRLREDRLRVLVVGEAKRGKSTVVNALLGRAVLPTGVTPLTAVATTVAYGVPEQVSAQTVEGHRETLALAALPDVVTEAGNPHNRRGLARVVVQLDAALLAEGIELVDTPGTGSVFAHNTAAARQALETMDAAIFVLTGDPPISDAERELLAQVRGASVATFVVLNKIDRLDAAERIAAVAFTEQVVGPGVRVYPCSARSALARATGADDSHVDNDAAQPDGFAAFVTDFTAYLRQDRERGLLRSLTRQAADWVGGLRDEVRVTRRADELRAGQDAARVEAFRGELGAVEQRRREAADLIQVQAGHLLEALNTAAAAAVASATAQILARLDELASGQPVSAAEIYQLGRDAALSEATVLVECWRAQQADVLQRGIDLLDERLRTGLERDLAAVRDAARTLLGTELALPAAGVRFAVDPRFHYAPPAPEGPTEAVVAAVRHHLPGRLGRERAVACVRAEAAELADRMVGRARGDLQYRLTETARAAASAIAERYTQCAVHLSSALDAAQRLRSLSQAEAQAARAELAAREQHLDALTRELSALGDEAQAEPDRAEERS